MRLLEVPPGASAAELESALKAALIGRLDLADSVIVYRDGSASWWRLLRCACVSESSGFAVL